MNKSSILFNGIAGFIFFAIFTILVESYEEHPYYLKISTFLWSAPLFFLFMIFITQAKGKKALISFTTHAIIGTALSILVFLYTLLISGQPLFVILTTNLLIIGFALFTYFKKEMYNI